MTLVIAANLLGTPLLMGDLLATSGPSQTPIQAIPTLGQEGFRGIYNDRAVTGIVQKLAVVNDYIAVGMTGSGVHASVFVKDLKAYVAERNASAEKLLDHIKSTISSDNYDLDVVGITLNENRFELFGTNREGIFDWQLGRCYVAGSGSTGFVGACKSLKSAQLNNFTDIDASLSAMMSLSGHLIAEEMNYASTLHYGYGAGFEYVVPYWDEKKTLRLKKLGDFASLFWRIDIDEAGAVRRILPSYIIFRQFYVKDLLFITRSLLTFEGMPVVKRQDKSSMFLVRPAYRYPTHDEKRKPPDLPETCTYYSHLLVVFKNNVPQRQFVSIDKTPTDIFLSYSNKNTSLTYSKAFLARIAQYVTGAE